MPTQDEVIAKHLEEARRSGELQSVEGFGKPLPTDEGWEATPDEFRLPFKILKNSGYVPPEVEMLRKRADLASKVQAASDEGERRTLMRELSALEQSISLRLEAMRTTGNL
jgi:hypothetical protein